MLRSISRFSRLKVRFGAVLGVGGAQERTQTSLKSSYRAPGEAVLGVGPFNVPFAKRG